MEIWIYFDYGIIIKQTYNLLALEISPQAKKGKPQGNIKPLHLVASPTRKEKALSGQSP